MSVYEALTLMLGFGSFILTFIIVIVTLINHHDKDNKK